MEEEEFKRRVYVYGGNECYDSDEIETNSLTRLVIAYNLACLDN